MQIERFKYVWKPFPHLKCRKGSKFGIGIDCPVYGHWSAFQSIPVKKLHVEVFEILIFFSPKKIIFGCYWILLD